MPRTSRPRRASFAPLILPNNEHEHHDRPHVEAGELCVGCIVWLPQKVDFAGSIKCSKQDCCGKELDEDGYEHPVVVLSVKQKEGSRVPGDLTCTVAFVTTFDDTSLQRYSKKRRRSSYLQESIPIFDPAAVLFETETIEAIEYLHVENGAPRKQSYVKLQHTYEIPCSSLGQYSLRSARACRAYNLRLNEVSYNVLMKKLKLDPQEFIATSQIPRTRESRLNLLAGIAIVRPAWTPPPPPPHAPPSPTPYRSALVGTIPPPPRTQQRPTAPVQPLSPRVQSSRYPAPRPAAHLPPPNYQNTMPSHYSNSTYYGTVSSSVPTYPRYTPPEPASPPAGHGHSEEGSGFGTLVVVAMAAVGAFLYWRYWY